jgi:phage-related protein
MPDFNATIGVNPSIGFKRNVKTRVDTAQFGDGYAQRTVSGLNPKNNEYSVVFQNQDLDTATAIINFLETAGTGDQSNGGVSYFWWTPPDETTAIKIICQEWDIEYSSPISRTISAKFIRVYDL